MHKKAAPIIILLVIITTYLNYSINSVSAIKRTNYQVNSGSSYKMASIRTPGVHKGIRIGKIKTIPKNETVNTKKAATTSSTQKEYPPLISSSIDKVNAVYIQPTIQTKTSASDPVPASTAPKIAFDLQNGTFSVNYSTKDKTKVIIKSSRGSYTYDLLPLYNVYPLQMGNGTYTVTVYKNISGTSYEAIKESKATLNLTNSDIVFLNSIQNIRWSSSTNAVVKARQIAKGTEEEKVRAIYWYIVFNITYSKSRTTNSTYVPDVSNVYNSKAGICYDFASLFAAMTRSVGIPTKLIMGTSTNVSEYHAWNEVYYNGSWKTIDTSCDSQLLHTGYLTTMVKTEGYSKQKTY